jgi:hypothetical protein
MKSAVIYIPEITGADNRQMMVRELTKLQRVIAEISDQLVRINQRVNELEKKHAE